MYRDVVQDIKGVKSARDGRQVLIELRVIAARQIAFSDLFGDGTEQAPPQSRQATPKSITTGLFTSTVPAVQLAQRKSVPSLHLLIKPCSKMCKTVKCQSPVMDGETLLESKPGQLRIK